MRAPASPGVCFDERFASLARICDNEVSHPPGQNPDGGAQLRRLRWHCRRGMLELDHLLLGFLDLGYASLDADQRVLFGRLLECRDQDLSDWLMSRRVPDDPGLDAMVRRIIAVAGASATTGQARDP